MSTTLFSPLTLPCGVVLKNRIIKSAMSDSLGDGTGHPTDGQSKLYRRWAKGGLAASIIGEVQCTPDFAEKPGNLVLDDNADLSRFKALAAAGRENDAQLWIQLGHAGALAYAPTSNPVGTSALNMVGLSCSEISLDDLKAVPTEFARTATLAKQVGFSGVQIQAAHGFLLSQFLSPLFNKRDDDYGGSIENRMRLLLESIRSVRAAVGPDFPIAIKLNSSDQLEGGLAEADALKIVETLDKTSVDLIDISGGTYFPGAKSASDGSAKGPYFLEFATAARSLTSKPLMLTGGFKTREQVEDALTKGVDLIGLARALIIEPSLPEIWQSDQQNDPTFPRFSEAPEGGITAWYTMQMTAIAEGNEIAVSGNLSEALEDYEKRDKARTDVWLRHFSP